MVMIFEKVMVMDGYGLWVHGYGWLWVMVMDLWL